jgi:hypothetical protein
MESLKAKVIDGCSKNELTAGKGFLKSHATDFAFPLSL